MTYKLPEIAGYDTADYEAAAVEEARSSTHQFNTYGWPDHGVEGLDFSDNTALWELVEEGNVTTDLFLQDPTARTATLGIKRMRGQWDLADQIQEEIIGPDSALLKEPYYGRVYDRHEPTSKLNYKINWGTISLDGLTLLTRRRKLLSTQLFDEKLILQDGSKVPASMTIEVDKQSTFLVDIERLDSESSDAAKELRLAIICGRVAMCNFSALKAAVGMHEPDAPLMSNGRLIENSLEAQQEALDHITFARTKAKKYGITPDEILQRIDEGHISQLRWPESQRVIEQEIENHSGLLIPAMTTFYAERKWHNPPAEASV